jgi:hypothetical protein
VPPNPKEFDKITLMFLSWAVWGTKFKSHPSEGFSKLSVGGTIPLLIAKIEKIASTDPAAPNK